METQIELNTYVTGAEELVWSLVLMASTVIIHGFGMALTLHATGSFKQRFGANARLRSGIAPVVVGSWMILAVHIVEIAMWAGFFQWKHCFANFSTAVYFTGLQYTTVGSTLSLPSHWRLLEIMVPSAGFMGFAWSTGVLMTLAQDFQTAQLTLLRSMPVMRRSKPDPSASNPRQTDFSE